MNMSGVMKKELYQKKEKVSFRYNTKLLFILTTVCKTTIWPIEDHLDLRL